ASDRTSMSLLKTGIDAPRSPIDKKACSRPQRRPPACNAVQAVSDYGSALLAGQNGDKLFDLLPPLADIVAFQRSLDASVDVIVENDGFETGERRLDRLNLPD